MIEVVGGLIVNRAGRILMTQRDPGRDFAWAWESPGGKVQGDESHHMALCRELMEEIDVDTGRIPEHALFCQEIPREGRESVFWLLYHVPVISGTPRPREGQGIGWFTADEMLRLTMTPGNTAAKEVVADFVRRLK